MIFAIGTVIIFAVTYGLAAEEAQSWHPMAVLRGER